MRYNPPASATYTVAGDGHSILCLKCGLRSHNENDIKHRYCGKCGWHDVVSNEDARITLSALLARACLVSSKARNPAVNDLVKQASQLIDAELSLEALGEMGGTKRS